MKKIGTYILVGLFIFIGLKSCMVTAISFDHYILVERSNEDGQKDRVILTPKNEMVYVKKYQELVEYGIYEVIGQEATHYISGIYCVGTFPFGLRFYKNAEKVYDAQLILSKKSGDSFPSIGEAFNSKIIIYPDKVKIGKYLYNRLSPNESEMAEFENMTIQLRSL